MKKKLLSMSLVAAMVLTQLSLPVAAKTNSLDTINAEVKVSAQATGDYVLPPKTITVNANLAEKYGYTDTVKDSVSTLDALVAEHIEIFGDDFKQAPGDYLEISSSGWITKNLGDESGAYSYYVNDVAPSTLVNATSIKTGDEFDIFIYEDKTYYTDRYTIFSDSTPETVNVNEEFTVTLNYYGYDSNYNTVILPVPGGQIGTLDMETGAVTEIQGALTDDDGKAKITFTQTGTYYITGYDTDDTDSQLIMNPLKITVVDPVAENLKKMNADITIQAQDSGKYLAVPKTIKVNGYLAESYGYTDTVKDSVSALDALVAEQIEMVGQSAFKAAPTSYISISESGWIQKIFGQDTGACSFYLNDEMTSTLIHQTPVKKGDNLNFFIYADKRGWTDKYTLFAKDTPQTAVENEKVAVTLQAYGFDASYNMVLLPLEKATIGTLDMKTGTVTEIKDVVTDKDGKAEITFAKAGTYYITAMGKDASGAQLVMNPHKITVVTPSIPAPAPAPAPGEVGSKFTLGGYKYQITSNTKNPTVAIKGYKNKKLTKVVIPATVTYKKVTYKVTAVGWNAFRGYEKLKVAVIGSNVGRIGKAAFAKDKNLKKIVVKSSVLKTVDKSALGGINKKAVIKVPAAKVKSYKKLFKHKNQVKTIKVTK